VLVNFHNDIEPQDCTGMDDIRIEIDALDRHVVALLGKRFKYVQAAAKFKTSENSVRAPERITAMLEQRRIWAASEDLSPVAIEKMFRDLVNHFINEEMSEWEAESTQSITVRSD